MTRADLVLAAGLYQPPVWVAGFGIAGERPDICDFGYLIRITINNAVLCVMCDVHLLRDKLDRHHSILAIHSGFNNIGRFDANNRCL